MVLTKREEEAEGRGMQQRGPGQDDESETLEFGPPIACEKGKGNGGTFSSTPNGIANGVV